MFKSRLLNKLAHCIARQIQTVGMYYRLALQGSTLHLAAKYSRASPFKGQVTAATLGGLVKDNDA